MGLAGKPTEATHGGSHGRKTSCDLIISTGSIYLCREMIAAASSYDFFAFSLHPYIMLDEHLEKRLSREIEYFTEDNNDWMAIAAHGRNVDEQEFLSAFVYESPNLSPSRGRRQIALASPLLCVINLDRLRRLDTSSLVSSDPANLVNAIIRLGYLGECPSYFSAYLYPVLTRSSSLDLPSTSEAWGLAPLMPVAPKALETRRVDDGTPAQRLVSGYHAATLAARRSPQFSFVVRTIFQRPHLLRRCLISIDYIRRTLRVPVEIVLASDLGEDLVADELRRLRDDFPAFSFVLADGRVEQGTSRVRNLTAGIKTTSGERVCIIDDDDYYLPLACAALTMCIERYFEGILLLGAQIVNEEWVQTSHKWHCRIVSYSTAYQARDWPNIFRGWNSLPLSSLVYPGDYIRSLINEYQFDHDLSEDFILHLMVFSDPRRPGIQVTDGISVHQSHRAGSDNVSTMEDRTRWCVDTGNGVFDLLLRQGRQFDEIVVARPAHAREIAGGGDATDLEVARRQVAALLALSAPASSKQRKKSGGKKKSPWGPLARLASLVRRRARAAVA